MLGTVPAGPGTPTGTVLRIKTPPTAAWAVAWAVTALAWSLVGASPSPSRLLGAGLIALLPALLLTVSAPPMRAGLAASCVLLLSEGLLYGDASGATLGTAVGGTNAWVAVTLARSALTPRPRIAGLALAVTGTVLLLLAPSVGPAGPRTAGAAIAIALGSLLGGRLNQAPTLQASRRTLLARSGIGLLVLVGIVRTFVDLDAPAVGLLLALRRFASLVLPTGTGIVGPAAAQVVSLALPWLLPFAGAAVALTLTVRSPQGASKPTRQERQPQSAGVTVLVALGMPVIQLLDVEGLDGVADARAPRDATGHRRFGPYARDGLVHCADGADELRVLLQRAQADREALLARLRARYDALFAAPEGATDHILAALRGAPGVPD